VSTLPEVQLYLERIEDLFGQVSALAGDLPAEALNWRPIEGAGEHATNSIAVLVAHVAGAAHFWAGEVVGGRPPTRVREAEFQARAEAAGDVVQLLDGVLAEIREELAALDGPALERTRDVRGHTYSVRWCILHIVVHTALHLGHVELTRQLWQSQKSGFHAPRETRFPKEIP